MSAVARSAGSGAAREARRGGRIRLLLSLPWVERPRRNSQMHSLRPLRRQIERPRRQGAPEWQIKGGPVDGGRKWLQGRRIKGPDLQPGATPRPICGGRDVGQRSSGRSSSVFSLSVCVFLQLRR
jgi:hypothetical protein